jgi:two-component system nitrogen regulation sensor histidine kinase NtrY
LARSITRGLDNWFGDTAEAVMEKNKQIFQDYVDNFESSFDVDVRLAALDVETFARDVKSFQLSCRERRAGDVEGDASSRRVRLQRCRKGFRQTLAYREFVTISIVSADGQEIIAEENAGTPVRLRPPPDAFRGSPERGSGRQRLYESQGMWHRR